MEYFATNTLSATPLARQEKIYLKSDGLSGDYGSWLATIMQGGRSGGGGGVGRLTSLDEDLHVCGDGCMKMSSL